MNIQKVSDKKILEAINLRIKDMHHMIGDDLYPDLMVQIREHKSEDAQKRMRINHYKAIDRIKFYIATHFVDTTIFELELELLAEKKERKKLKKIINGLESLTYEEVRSAWHKELKFKYYAQKENRIMQKNISKKAIVFRIDSFGTGKSGFVYINPVNLTVEIVKRFADATEFPVGGLSKEYLKYIEDAFLNKYHINALPKIVQKVKGREISFLL